MLIRLKLFVISGLLIFATSCVTRVVVIDSNSDVIRIGKNVKGEVYIYRNNQWESVGKAIIPEGWYAGPMK